MLLLHDDHIGLICFFAKIAAKEWLLFNQIAFVVRKKRSLCKPKLTLIALGKTETTILSNCGIDIIALFVVHVLINQNI